MRLILRLKALEDQKYDINYNRKFQSFIYNTLRNTHYHYLHDFVKYKNQEKNSEIKRSSPFCFSNLFPYGDMRRGSIKNIIISSPDEDLIFTLYKKIIQTTSIINLGKSAFKISNTKVFRLKLNGFKFTTLTPVIIRIPEYRYKNYDLDLKHPYKYIFWRKEYPLEMFFQQLETNLQKKYHRFYNNTITIKLFNLATFMLKKQVSHKVSINGKEQILIGTMWDFWFDDLDYNSDVVDFTDTTNHDDNKMNQNNKTKQSYNILNFFIESGFGERNSLGYGFINPL